jgi:hypothetical protein
MGEVDLKIKFKSELLFRKAFIPWYDTELSLILTLIFAVVVLLFSMMGIAAALDTPSFSGYIWVPCLLMGLSLVLTVSSLIRLIRRGENG